MTWIRWLANFAGSITFAYRVIFVYKPNQVFRLYLCDIAAPRVMINIALYATAVFSLRENYPGKTIDYRKRKRDHYDGEENEA